jgi:two-component system, LytTR family, response regulator
MIRAIIIDDEKTSRDALLGLITRYCNEVTIVEQANGYKSGIEAIEKHNPDLVFLDIQMPDGSGFQLLEDIKEINFEIIFTTAFDQYAIKAIKYSALDYLLKPIVPSDLVTAIQKLVKKKSGTEINSSIKVLLDNLKNKSESKKIVLSTLDQIHVVAIEDIVRCESDDCYTRFILNDGKVLLICKTLKEYDMLLEEQNFLRPHKSHLININHISGYFKNDGGCILMSDGAKVPVARRKKDKVLSIIQKL